MGPHERLSATHSSQRDALLNPDEGIYTAHMTAVLQSEFRFTLYRYCEADIYDINMTLGKAVNLASHGKM